MLIEAYKYSSALLASGLAALRLDFTNALVSTNAHPWAAEAVRLNRAFQLSTAAAGVTLAAANILGAANAQPLVGIFNPLSSGVNVFVYRGVHVWNSGTSTAGGLAWGVAPSNAGVTAANGTSPTSVLTSRTTGSAVQGYVNQAMTGITGAAIAGYAGGPTVGAVAANANLTFVDSVDGVICIPPGGAGGLFAATGGNNIVNASMYWEEIPVG